MHHVVASVFKQEYAKVFATLLRRFGDFDLVEDALQDAFISALRTWEADGVPDRPGAWLTTVADHRAKSLLRQRRRNAPDVESVVPTPADEIDERLALVFTCCHPALALDARVALTLKVMCGLSTASIARLFLTTEPTIAQRLLRAKTKIRDGGIPFRVPNDDELSERVEGVLAVIYLLFTEGYAATEGTEVMRTELCEEALRLGRMMTNLLPTHAEARGLHALMCLHHARRRARVSADGEIVALDDQDPALHDAAAVEEGVRNLDDALARGRPGPYQVQAAIAALHATTRDWTEIAALYDELLRMQPSPAVEIAAAIAVGMANGPSAGLARLERLPDDPITLAARADLLRRAGDPGAAFAYDRAIEAARNERERRFLRRQRERL